MPLFKNVQAVGLSVAVAVGTSIIPTNAVSGTVSAELQSQQGAPGIPAPVSGTPSESELQQIVAPIALYPDALVAQVLAGSTYPTQLVEADRWLKQNKNLTGDQLAAAVDRQPWDDSIKALSQFPSVLDNMNKNLSWTSALGDAYFNDTSGVMNAIQILRRDAQNAGNLNSTPQQTVSTEGQTIVIQPAQPEVVYVPEYSPAVYGTPIEPYPGYSGWGVAAASALSFGAGLFVGGAWNNNAWGWNRWGADWRGGNVQFNRNTWNSRSNTFANRNTRYNNISRGDINRNISGGNINRNISGGNINRNLPNRSVNPLDGSGARSKPTFGQPGAGIGDRGNTGASRGFGSADRSSVGRSSGTFSGFSQGGGARFDSSRGSSSFSRGSYGGGSRGGGGGRSSGFSGGGGSRGGGGGGGRRGGGGGGRR